ncbi:iron-containing alcohol dehydrogenase [Paenibacillus cremeus]|uniref:Iron-containing alcohol dehydrogenase n=1 Tax=Paenibacillus cremeus TaxID=2163881 RepID=A0A559KG15_9BACL|nr:iron-containing alcohol dehydrogenase [Paenibacillus cremeus]TVY11062.1 iron-containing alcohol dehydrogenase [Paenibacillus cremeus]
MQVHQLLLPEKVVYGPDALLELGALAAAYGSKALIVTDQVMLQSGVADRCVQLLKSASIDSSVYAGVLSEPTHSYVDEGLAQCAEHTCDLIIAIGGGSCLDTAKAIAVMSRNDGFIGDYRKKRFANAPLPLIAIPTTAGTGSEVTKVTVITDTRTDEKMMIAQPELLPRVALVDPLLTLSCPPHVTAATGIDALSHAVEAYLSRKAHPVTDALALSAVKLISANLLTAYRDGSDVQARAQMITGAMLAGAAFSNASVALVHGMSRPIGALFHVPHGISNAMLLPAVLEYSQAETVNRLAEIGRAMRPDLLSSGLSEEAWADTVIRQIKWWCVQMQIPNLQRWGIDQQRFEAVLEKMAADAIVSGSPANHPKIPDAEDIMRLYRICYTYDFHSNTDPNTNIDEFEFT